MMDQMNVNRGMWPSDGSTATGGPAAVAAPPQPYAQPTMQSAAQQLVFTPVAGAGIAAGGAENTTMTEANVGETRGREASPPRQSAPSARLAVRVWESAWLRELTAEEGTVHAELDGDEIRTLMKIGEDEVYPPAAFMD